MSPSAQRLIRYGAIAAVCVVVAIGAIHFFGRSDTEQATSAAPAREQTTAARPSAGGQAILGDDDQTPPSDAATDRALRLLGEARRLADDGKFDEAKAKLDEVEKAVPGLGETVEARRKIADMATPQGQIATQLGRARVAIDSDDDAAAEKALAEAERLQPQAPEIAQLRQALQASQKKEAARHARIVELLTTMREAIARRDFAAADGALNEALRLDVLDPLIDPARGELARAHDAERKAEAGR